MSASSSPRALQEIVSRRLPRYLAELEALVNIDCGSYTPEGVNRVADAVESALRAIGADVERIPDSGAHEDGRLGDVVVGHLAGSGPRLLLIGHMDTVFDPGTAANRPFRIDGARATGPGVTDMKAGLLAGLHALAALAESGVRRSVTLVANPDEEIGSPVSTPIIRSLAADHDIALVLECARANGDIVSARKGVAEFRIELRGRAAHAGIEPEKGRSAVLAAAHQAIAIDALNGRWPSVTANVGVIAGGTRPNVVADACRLEVDLRAASTGEFDEACAALDEVAARPVIPGVLTRLQQLARHPVMERGPGAERLVRLAQRLAAELGFAVHDAATGGASDANTTAALGLPTLDGLGPIGGDDHSDDEWLDLASIVPRTALLAALIADAGEAL